MTVAHTTALELLGKQVSFITTVEVDSTVYPSHHLGVVTDIVLSLTSELQISLNDGDFYSFSDLLEFKIL